MTKQQNVDNYFSVARQDIKFAVHAHPTLSEVLDELFKSAKVSHLKNLGNGFLLFLGTFARASKKFRLYRIFKLDKLITFRPTLANGIGILFHKVNTQDHSSVREPIAI